jgi:hypothetical protein
MFTIIQFKLFKEPWNNGLSPSFYEQLFRQYSFAKKIQCQTVIREKLRKTLSNKKKTHEKVDEIDTLCLTLELYILLT